MGIYGLAYIIKVEQCEHIKIRISMKQLLLICAEKTHFYDAHMAINKNKLIEARWRKIYSQTGTR